MTDDISIQSHSSPEQRADTGAPQPSVLFVCNDLAYFAAHRASLAEALLALGARVHLCAAGGEAQAGSLSAEIVFHPVELQRHSFAPASDLRFMLRCRALARELNPDIVHLITMKPNVFGGLALALSGSGRESDGRRPKVVMTFPGLGRIFESGQSLGGRLRRFLTLAGLRRAAWSLKADATFENSADRENLVAHGVFPLERTHVTFGAGIDTSQFRPAQEARRGPLCYLFASRLLNAKGLGVFLEAARQRKREGSDASFIVAGFDEPGNSDSFSPEELTAAAGAGIVEYRGAVDGADMPKLLRSVDIVCLPTRLSEGFPRILIEAAASGCALIASRQPSIAQIIEHGQTGCMIDPSDVSDLLAVMSKLDAAPHLARRMGANAAEYARRMPADETQVNAAFLKLYGMDD